MRNSGKKRITVLTLLTFAAMFCMCLTAAACEETTPATTNNPGYTLNGLTGQIDVEAQLQAILGTSAAQPNITVSPSTLNFGQVEWMKQSASQDIKIANSGQGVLVMSFKNLKGASTSGQTAGNDGIVEDDGLDYHLSDSGFTYNQSQGTYSLNPGATGTISVCFQPRDIGNSNATMQCISNDPDQGTIVISFSGTGTAPAVINNPVNDVVNGVVAHVTGVVKISFALGQNYYTQDGQQVAMDAAPFVENGRTYVPLRYLGAALGAFVSWNDSTQTAEFSKGGHTLAAQPGSNLLFVDNILPVPIDVPVVERGGRLYLPARFIAEQFGYIVGWDENSQEVTLTQ